MKVSAASPASASRSCSREVRAGRGAVADGVHAEQRLGQAQPLHHRPRGRARAEDVEGARAHAGDHFGGDVVERPLLTGHPAGLGALGEAARVRDGHVAVEVGGDPVVTEGLFVDVHDLALAQLHAGGTLVQEERGHVAGGGRRGRVHGRVDLDAGRDADDRDTVADRVTDVARGAVAAGEEDEVHAGGEQIARRLLRIVRRRQDEVVAGNGDWLAAAPLELAEHVRTAAGERSEHARVKPGGARLVLAHLAGPGEDLDVVTDAGEALQRLPRAPRRVARGAALERPAQDVGARRCP